MKKDKIIKQCLLKKHEHGFCFIVDFKDVYDDEESMILKTSKW